MSLPKNLITIYGRNPVLEALENKELKLFALHLSKSNKANEKINKISQLAKKRNIDIKYHTKEQLSRISKNGKQDQGVALDIVLNNIKELDFLSSFNSYKVLALDGITNPQNLGMIIRSATAGNIDAIILQKKGSASLVSALTIKASVGTLFKLPIIQVTSLYKALQELQSKKAKIVSLSLDTNIDIKSFEIPKKSVFILGNESVGVSKEILELSDKKIKILMNRGVESLNVAVTASLIAFLD